MQCELARMKKPVVDGRGEKETIRWITSSSFFFSFSRSLLQNRYCTCMASAFPLFRFFSSPPHCWFVLWSLPSGLWSPEDPRPPIPTFYFISPFFHPPIEHPPPLQAPGISPLLPLCIFIFAWITNNSKRVWLRILFCCCSVLVLIHE